MTPSLKNSGGQASMKILLQRWAAHDWLRPLDAAFADFLWREVPDAPPLLMLAAALASHQLGRGHTCLDLAATLKNPAFALSLPPEWRSAPEGEEPPPLPAEALVGVSLPQWQAALTHPALVARGSGDTPLVCVGSRLYLRRYWQYEQSVRAGIDRRLAHSAGLQAALPVAALRQALETLFPPSSRLDQTTHWPKLACALAARSAFSILTGGPGTGKTTTVIRLLALLQALALAAAPSGRILRIGLAAPTGKAAARLNESIAGAVAHLPLDGLDQGETIRHAIPVAVTTLHRLLGSRADSRRFRHHAGHPLALDALVIDEASMVDLEMLAAVLDALPVSARLILLGDKDQLASVEAGAVLGELCQRAHGGHYTPATRNWLKETCGEPIDPALIDEGGTALDQAVVMLRHSHRFAARSGIGRLASAVNAGDSATLASLWKQGYADLALLPLANRDDPAFQALVIEGGLTTTRETRRGYRYYLDVLRQNQPARGADPSVLDAWAGQVLEAHGQFQVLCALRRGPWGVEGLNQHITHLLRKVHLIPKSRDDWYSGRPVLVTRNDYDLGLMNGDIGITLWHPAGKDQRQRLRVAFARGDGTQGIRWVLPSRLQTVETVYALTVHKSQGSEFTHAALVLPDTINPILTRELLYTGITRARHCLTLVRPGDEKTLEQAVAQRVLRASGLLLEG